MKYLRHMRKKRKLSLAHIILKTSILDYLVSWKIKKKTLERWRGIDSMPIISWVDGESNTSILENDVGWEDLISSTCLHQDESIEVCNKRPKPQEERAHGKMGGDGLRVAGKESREQPIRSQSGAPLARDCLSVSQVRENGLCPPQRWLASQ